MKIALRLILLILVMFAPMFFYAQPDPPAGGGPPCGPPFGPVCPIDGGISFLVAAGLALGGKMSYNMSRKKMNG